MLSKTGLAGLFFPAFRDEFFLVAISNLAGALKSGPMLALRQTRVNIKTHDPKHFNSLIEPDRNGGRRFRLC
jgi:hypothetical protein